MDNLLLCAALYALPYQPCSCTHTGYAEPNV